MYLNTAKTQGQKGKFIIVSLGFYISPYFKGTINR